ncbi:hypothetical protein [Natronorubrum halophilum]|uniref:hypothetical protein n=1 Tax=Natronorubrum halophilum TaxID=1702106 RepID=UPI0010C22C91|nr:hypothetical protein [Natronorubrum halophilum]
MSNPFDDLKEDDADSTESADALESEPETDSDQAPDEPSITDAETSDESATERPEHRDESDEKTDEPLSAAEAGPAFEYSQVQQKPFYARTETVNEFENKIRTTIVPTLAEAEILDEETREIHDAVLRLASEQPERIAELILEERRESGR